MRLLYLLVADIWKDSLDSRPDIRKATVSKQQNINTQNEDAHIQIDIRITFSMSQLQETVHVLLFTTT